MRGWQSVRTADGSWTLRHPLHGEACHSLAGAWQQARERYARPCRLRELALERARASATPWVRLLDIGTGIGWNLAAALEALQGTGARLFAVSLEADADVLRLARELPTGPPEMERWHAPVRAALSGLSGRTGPEISLLMGDARESLPRVPLDEPFDAAFLDPFSRAVDPWLWELSFLREVAARMAPWAVLSTYSSSLAVRRTLAAAGLVPGLGPRVGTKASGTLASRCGGLPPLPRRVQRRLGRARPGSGVEESRSLGSETRPGIA